MRIEDDRADRAECGVIATFGRHRAGLRGPLLHQLLATLLGNEVQRVGKFEAVLSSEPVGTVAVQQDVLCLLHDRPRRGNRVTYARTACNTTCRVIFAAHDGCVVADVTGFIEHCTVTGVE
jgi:hypothetical protein